MPYIKHHWTCGETITDNAMNNIEDAIEEALDCCNNDESFVSIIVEEKNSSYVIQELNGDFDEIYAKVSNHEEVDGLLTLVSDYNTSSYNLLARLAEIATSADNGLGRRLLSMQFMRQYLTQGSINVSEWYATWDEADGITYIDKFDVQVNLNA